MHLWWWVGFLRRSGRVWGSNHLVWAPVGCKHKSNMHCFGFFWSCILYNPSLDNRWHEKKQNTTTTIVHLTICICICKHVIVLYSVTSVLFEKSLNSSQTFCLNHLLWVFFKLSWCHMFVTVKVLWFLSWWPFHSDLINTKLVTLMTLCSSLSLLLLSFNSLTHGIRHYYSYCSPYVDKDSLSALYFVHQWTGSIIRPPLSRYYQGGVSLSVILRCLINPAMLLLRCQCHCCAENDPLPKLYLLSGGLW